MFATYFDDSVRFTGIMGEHPAIALGTIAINLLSLVLSIAAIIYLDLSWVSVGHGILATMGIGLVFGAIIGAICAVSPRFVAWTMEHLGPVTFIGSVLTMVYTVLGFSLFVGLSAALAVVVLPALVISPMIWVLRSWALRTY